MPTVKTGADLFIVDNSVSGWTGLRYLQQWTDIAKRFDIATGFFEIGGLLDLDGKWQQLEKIRILMGDEVTQRTRQALLEAIRARAADNLDQSIEGDKDKNPFLHGVPAIVDALRSGQIECKVYDKDKFHAKTYITHAKLDVVGAQALVGSSNFTRPGLTQNVELNIQVQSGREVAQLQEWFEYHWEQAKDISEDILNVIARHTHAYTPFDVYAKALYEFFRGHEMTDSEWEESRSKVFPQLDRYQKEAYWAMLKIARQHGGAFLCDGVGLGKSFVGMMLIERMILREGKRVVLLAPKAAKDAVWEPHLKEWLPHIGGFGGSADFSNLVVLSHTDLDRKGDFPERLRRIAELADVVIIDEAHHFRNPGKLGDPEAGINSSRYYRLYNNLLDMSQRPKLVYMLTATPINNELQDFRHMIELFSKRDEPYFAKTLGINNLRAYFTKLERDLRKQLHMQNNSTGELVQEASQFLMKDQLFQHIVVQRSRAYARESQLKEGSTTTIFPERKAPRVAEYSIRKTYGNLLVMVERAFDRQKPLFSLSIYYPLAYYKGPSDKINPWEENRQKQVVGLIRTLFLKRFESSVHAFKLSCDRLMKKFIAFLEVHSETDAEKRRLARWQEQNAEVLKHAQARQSALWGDDPIEEIDDDIVPQEMLDDVTRLSRDEYEVEEIIAETFLDLDQIVDFLKETKRFEPEHDDKLKKLIRLLKSKDLEDKKVLIFTEFADTARYLHGHLKSAGVTDIDEVDSGTKTNRAEIIKRFSPYYNGTTSAELASKGTKEIRVLLSTDVLSEGLNLQDACRIINYDIHWNPVRLMQRIGRVDRRLNPTIEEALVRDHPEASADRGTVIFWNFLPPEELNRLLTLYSRVTRKTLLISKTLGIEGKKLLTPQDDYEALREFNHTYEGEKTAIEDMHLEYQALLEAQPELAAHLKSLPGTMFSGRQKPAKGAIGVFFCYSLPALDKTTNEFSEEAGMTGWYFYHLPTSAIIEEPSEIIRSIRAKPTTPRKLEMSEEALVEIRAKVLKHIKNNYLKRLDAPLGVKATLKCWMEINGE